MRDIKASPFPLPETIFVLFFFLFSRATQEIFSILLSMTCWIETYFVFTQTFSTYPRWSLLLFFFWPRRTTRPASSRLPACQAYLTFRLSRQHQQRPWRVFTARCCVTWRSCLTASSTNLTSPSSEPLALNCTERRRAFLTLPRPLRPLLNCL